MNQELTTGLKYLLEVEKSRYFMTNGLEIFDKEISKLGHSRKISKPSYPRYDHGGGAAFFTCIVIGAIVGAIVGIIYTIIASDRSIILKTIECIGGAICGVFYSILPSAVVGVLAHFIAKKKTEAKNETKYSAELENYNKKINSDNERVQRELRQKKLLTDQRATLKRTLTDTEKKLDSYYSHMGIDEKYRGIIVIYYMYEYARLGICDCLDGPFGLYRVIDDKLDREIMKMSLSTISDKLDSIAERQEELYMELRDINVSCNKILTSSIKQYNLAVDTKASIDRVASNTEIAAYYARLSFDQQIYSDYFLH